jgi:hypothetical protein
MARKRNVREIQCESWEGLQDVLAKAAKALGKREGEGLWFRGCRECDHALAPTLMRVTDGLSRKDHDQAEQDLFFEFQARASELRQRGLNEWEYLFFGRHYGVPTRVLDWSDTFGVALYFALEEWDRDKDHGRRRPAIWAINPFALNEANWAEERDIILPRYLGMNDDDGEYWDFGELLLGDGDWAWDGPVAIYPIQINERVRAQRGWFTIHGQDRRALDEQYPQFVVKIVLEAGCLEGANDFLQLAGFNRFSIYPDLDNLARWLREQTVEWTKARTQRRKKKHLARDPRPSR